jgi:hypothetical protein
MKTTLSDWDAENLQRLHQRNIRRRECNGVKVQSLNRLVKKGLAIRFTGAFGEDEWAINAAAKPPGLVELEEILKVQATEAFDLQARDQMAQLARAGIAAIKRHG